MNDFKKSWEFCVGVFYCSLNDPSETCSENMFPIRLLTFYYLGFNILKICFEIVWPALRQCFAIAGFSSSSNFMCEKCTLKRILRFFLVCPTYYLSSIIFIYICTRGDPKITRTSLYKSCI